MPKNIRIALDAMGGDHGPSVVISGAAEALIRHPDTEFVLVGDQAVINPLLDARPSLRTASRVVHADVAVMMDEKPSQALRRGRWKSSMWLTLDAVKRGEADAAVSAGNTGALMAMSRFNLKMLPDIERPAIAAVWPTLRGESIVLDCGASIGAEAGQLVDMAVMGAAMARIFFELERPTVGLLNIGVEEVKGLEPVREAGRILKDAQLPGLDYQGFIEGNDIGMGTVDVVVTEGFAGNIALKTAEGTARQIVGHLREAMKRTLRARIGYVLAQQAFQTLREKIDPRKANGGIFLGLNGIVIKSHGSTDTEGFASAIDMSYDFAKYALLNQISEALAQHKARAVPVEVAS